MDNPFYENTCGDGHSGLPTDQDGAYIPYLGYPWGTTPGNEHMYAKAYNYNCMIVGDLGMGEYTSPQCFGTFANSQSAEAIVERHNLMPWFFTTTFHGVGVTETNNGFVPMSSSSIHHDYSNMQGTNSNLVSCGPIQYDAGDPPYDSVQLSVGND